MIIKSLNFSGKSLLSLVSALDKIQLRATTNFLSDKDIAKILRYHDFYCADAESVIVSAIGAYSYPNQKFSTKCTKLVFNGEGGTVSRITAPEAEKGIGPRYTIAIINPKIKITSIPSFSISRHESSDKFILLHSYFYTYRKQLKKENQNLDDQLQLSLF